MRIPNLEDMIAEEESKVEFAGFIGFNGDLVEVDQEGNHVIVGRVDIGSVTFGNVMRVTHAYPRP